MEVLYILIPTALLLVGVIVVVFFWAVKSGQFDDLEGPAWEILMDDDEPQNDVSNEAETNGKVPVSKEELSKPNNGKSQSDK